MNSDWTENTNTGNFMLIEDGELVAVVFERGGSWKGLWKSPGGDKWTKGKWDDPADAIDAVEDGMIKGTTWTGWWRNERNWTKSKPKRGFDAQGRPVLREGFWRRGPQGAVLSVRQTTSRSWAASKMGDMLTGPDGAVIWFRTAAAAAAEMDRRYPGGGRLPGMPAPVRTTRVAALPIASDPDPIPDILDVLDDL